MTASKKIIFVDWNKTLSYSLFWEHLKDADPSIYTKIDTWLFVENRDIIKPWMLGEKKSTDVILAMSKDINVSYDRLLDEFIKSCERMTWAFDGVEAYINAIRKKGIKVVIATDNMDSFEKYTVPSMNIVELFDDYLVSSTIGHLKDEDESSGIKFFDNYLQNENLTYEDAVLLDDSEDKNGKYRKNLFDRIIIDSPETLKKHLAAYANT